MQPLTGVFKAFLAFPRLGAFGRILFSLKLVNYSFYYGPFVGLLEYPLPIGFD
jgi:hypothetical protein